MEKDIILSKLIQKPKFIKYKSTKKKKKKEILLYVSFEINYFPIQFYIKLNTFTIAKLFVSNH